MNARYDLVEILKKDDYKECTSSSDSKSNERNANRFGKLKRLPKLESRRTKKHVVDLRAMLPDLTFKHVRRFYMPYHEAILLELEEQNYRETAQRMKEFLELDEKIGETLPGTLIKKKVYLKDRKDFIDRLKDGFIAFEKAERRGDCAARATTLLDVALFFQSKTWEWWWIAERLYQTALKAAESIENDNRRTITLIRYLYGRFLLHELQNPREALDYLKEARDLSKTKMWNTLKTLGGKPSSIFKECNVLLYKALLILARQERPKDPDYALKACTEATKSAADAGNPEYVNEALHELGKSYIAVNDIEHALKSFSKLLALAKRIPDAEGVCTAHMELAFAYKQLDDNVRTEQHLRMFRENAEQFGLFEKFADAHYYTGEHYLSQGKTNLSTAHLESALILYTKLGLSRETDRARCIAGISKGQERIEEYFKLLLRCGDGHDKRATLKICLWKGRRESFWTDEINISDEKSDAEVQYEISEKPISSTQSFSNDNDPTTSQH
ncbi:uncharacterized protein LOC143144212 [Ptiloglossa arizonensis]|uniref:uncharacterized protein LOC143144212 n=1 Tax=Ptiloglossa arizonensis TaxID=3350558 RepID=UPI003F9F0985